MSTAAPVIALDHPAAFDAARVGRKAAALAKARAAGLPVGSGVVLTTQWCHEDQATALQVWRIISLDGALPLVVRPSAVGRDRTPADASTIESTVVVYDAAGLLAAIDDIRLGEDRSEANVPVLVQPHCPGPWRGVLFDDGSTTGRRRQVVVARRHAAEPHDGDEWIAELDHHGRVRDVLSGDHPDQQLDHPPVELLARLARLSQRISIAFGGPHDIEWSVDHDGMVHLLRFRPMVRLRSASTDGARTAGFCARRSARPVLTLVDDGRADGAAA